MRSSFMAAINCIGSITILQYFYLNFPTLFSNWWVLSLAIIILALLSAIVLHFKTFLAIGASGTSIFLISIKDNVFSNVIHKELTLFENIAITLIIVILIAIIIELLVSTSITVYNIIFDIIIAILIIALISWLAPMISESLGITAINTLALPIILLVYFISIICINFRASYRDSKISTKSKISDDESESEEVEV